MPMSRSTRVLAPVALVLLLIAGFTLARCEWEPRTASSEARLAAAGAPREMAPEPVTTTTSTPPPPTTTTQPAPPPTTAARHAARQSSAPRSSSGMSARTRARIAGCESAGNPNAFGSYTAQNPHSTASGRYQVLDSTWAGYGGYRHAKDAPPATQEAWMDEASKGGTGPWKSSASCWG